MAYELLFTIVVCLIPSVYLAGRRNYVIIPNVSYDSFITRFIFIGPAVWLKCLMVYVFLWAFLDLTLASAVPGVYRCVFGLLAADVSIILYYRFFVLQDNMPFERDPDFMEKDLYLFTPVLSPNQHVLRSVFDDYSYAEGHKEITVDLEDLAGKPILFTRGGELIVDQETLDVFHRNGLRGFRTIPVRDTKTNEESDTHSLIITEHILPACSPKTTLKAGWAWERLVFDGFLFYDRSVLKECGDFNRSSETIDRRTMLLYGPQRYWILSQKAVRVLVGQLGQSKKDFLPVYLDDDG